MSEPAPTPAEQRLLFGSRARYTPAMQESAVLRELDDSAYNRAFTRTEADWNASNRPIPGPGGAFSATVGRRQRAQYLEQLEQYALSLESQLRHPQSNSREQTLQIQRDALLSERDHLVAVLRRRDEEAFAQRRDLDRSNEQVLYYRALLRQAEHYLVYPPVHPILPDPSSLSAEHEIDAILDGLDAHDDNPHLVDPAPSSATHTQVNPPRPVVHNGVSPVTPALHVVSTPADDMPSYTLH